MTPTVACVLRSGGRYTPEWVLRLKRGIERHASGPHRFVCLSDVDVPGVEVLPLREGWPGWWSKIELFRPGLLTGPTIYLDLDVVVTGDVAPLFRACGTAPCDGQGRGGRPRTRGPSHRSMPTA